MPEPTLSEVHADLAGRLDTRERLRAVELDLAALKLLPAEMRRMEDRLVTEIRDTKPKPPWAAVSAVVAAVGLILIIAAAIYGQ